MLGAFLGRNELLLLFETLLREGRVLTASGTAISQSTITRYRKRTTRRPRAAKRAVPAGAFASTASGDVRRGSAMVGPFVLALQIGRHVFRHQAEGFDKRLTFGGIECAQGIADRRPTAFQPGRDPLPVTGVNLHQGAPPVGRIVMAQDQTRLCQLSNQDADRWEG